MRRGGGSNKGSSFEREICKTLSLWWTDGIRDDVFWRTAGSGGRATNRARMGRTTAGAEGDLTATDPIGSVLLRLCCFELKRGYNKVNPLDVIERRDNAKPCILEDFWAQALNSTMQSRAHFPVVIFKRDQKRTSIMCARPMLLALACYLGPDRSPKIQVRVNTDNAVIMRFEDWIDYITPDSIKSFAKELGYV